MNADPEVAISSYLRDALDARVSADPPPQRETFEDPWVQYVLLDAPSVGAADRLVAAFLDLDVYAGSGNDRAEASELARATRRAIVAIRGVVLAEPEPVVFSKSEIDGYRRLPDEDFEKARERYIVTATIWMHDR